MGNGDNMNLTDITTASDLTVEAFLAWKSGDESFNFSALAVDELERLAEMLPDVDFSSWIMSARLEERREMTRTRPHVDYEALILAEAEQYWDPL